MRWMAWRAAAGADLVGRWEPDSDSTSGWPYHHGLRTLCRAPRRVPCQRRPQLRLLGRHVGPHSLFCFFITFIEPQGHSHGELNQPSPQCKPTDLSLSRFMAVAKGVLI